MGLTNIQWTSGPEGQPGFTFNPWIGCRKVAPECKNCYAETLDRNRFSKTMPGCSKEAPISHWGEGPRYRTSESNWNEPVKWNRKAEDNHRIASFGHTLSPSGVTHYAHRPRVFCASLSDWLDDENVPIEWLADLLKLIHDTPNLDWLLLTKRPQNWQARLEKVVTANEEASILMAEPPSKLAHFADRWLVGIPPENVWIGVSAGADQAAALAIPARIHFLSCEPMLKPMDTTHAAGFDWIIFGGESGKKARPCAVDWIRAGIAFCDANKIACFVKQLGSAPSYRDDEDWDEFSHRPTRCAHCGRKCFRIMPTQDVCQCGAWMSDSEDRVIVPFDDSHGGDMSEWPEDLRIREFPTIKPALT